MQVDGTSQIRFIASTPSPLGSWADCPGSPCLSFSIQAFRTAYAAWVYVILQYRASATILNVIDEIFPRGRIGIRYLESSRGAQSVWTSYPIHVCEIGQWKIPGGRVTCRRSERAHRIGWTKGDCGWSESLWHRKIQLDTFWLGLWPLTTYTAERRLRGLSATRQLAAAIRPARRRLRGLAHTIRLKCEPSPAFVSVYVWHESDFFTSLELCI